jgi:hypothetical protein
MRFTRRRSNRPDSARSRLGSGLEELESRQLLASGKLSALFAAYAPSDLSVTNPITQKPVAYSVVHQILHNSNAQSSLFTNEGKIVSGKNRAGDEWTITVHGPGYAIITDTTPNDGVLADEIDTIQLVGTDINKTYVTGNVVGSDRVQTSGTIPFNRLVDLSGVRSVILNGFTLSQTVAPANGAPNNSDTGIFLTGGVRYLQFHDIEAPVDTSTNDVAVNVVIGDPSTPLKVEPTIKLDHIFNTVFDSTTTTPPANTAQTTPTVNIVVNGQIRGLGIFSATQAQVSAADQVNFPIVGTTGRTSVQSIGIGHLTVHASATNLTASRSSTPFQNGFTGLKKLGKATFQGHTDAVGLDVNGPIGKLTYARGMGNPAGTFIGQTATGQGVPATSYGQAPETAGYAAQGYVAGQVTATNIRSVKIGPSNVVTLSPTNPDFGMLTRQGTTTAIAQPGTAMVNSLIATSGSIGKVSVLGNQVNSEIKTGFHYPSFAAGLEGTRAASSISKVGMKGSQINGVISATYRPNQHYYGSVGSVKGPGSVKGHVTGSTLATGAITPLTNIGSGTYARVKKGALAPPQRPSHLNGRLVK